MDNKIIKVTEKQKQLLDRNMKEINILKQQISIMQASTTDIITVILSSNGIDEEKNVRYEEGNIYIIENELSN